MTQTEIIIGLLALALIAVIIWLRPWRMFTQEPEEDEDSETADARRLIEQTDLIAKQSQDIDKLKAIINKHSGLTRYDPYPIAPTSIEEMDLNLSRRFVDFENECLNQTEKENYELRLQIASLRKLNDLKEHMTQPIKGIVHIICTAVPLYADVKGSEYKILRTYGPDETSMLGIMTGLTEALIALECPVIPKRVIGASVEELFPKAESVDDPCGPIKHTDQVPEHPEQNQQKDATT